MLQIRKIAYSVASRIPIYEDLQPIKLDKSYTEEELIRMDTEDLDMMAFGFHSGDLLEVHPESLTVIYDDDLENARDQAEREGWELWAKKVDLSDPIEVKLKHGRLQIEDGHHRYLAAKILGSSLLAIVEIWDNPIEKILM